MSVMSFAFSLVMLTQALPLTDPNTWAASASYPASAIRNGDAGKVEYELTVNAAGLVTGCKVLTSSGSAALDEATCRHMSRVGRFKPLENASDRVASYQGHMRWSLDNTAGDLRTITLQIANLAAGRVGSRTIVAFGVTSEGGAQNCQSLSSSGDVKLDRAGCEQVRQKARFTPSEKPQPHQRLAIEWQ